MTIMNDYEYIVRTPDDWGWYVTVTDNGVTYTAGGTIYYWHDEDEVVAAIESGLVDDDEWCATHNEWEA